MIIYRKNIFSRKSLKPTFLFKWTSVSLFSRRLFLLFFVQRLTMLCRRKTFFKSLIVVGQKMTELSFLQHKRLEGTQSNPAGILLDPAWGEHLGERDPALMADCLSRFSSENWADFFQILSLQSLFFKFSFSSTSLTAKIKMQDFNTLVPNSKPKNNSTDEQVIPQTFPARKHLQPPPSLHPPQSNASYFGFLPFSSVCVSAPEQRGASWRSSGRLACRLFYRCCFLMHRLYTDRVMRWWWGGVFVEECVDRGGVPADRGDGPLDLTGLVPQLRFPLFSLLTAAEDPTRVLLLFFLSLAPRLRESREKLLKPTNWVLWLALWCWVNHPRCQKQKPDSPGRTTSHLSVPYLRPPLPPPTPTCVETAMTNVRRRFWRRGGSGIWAQCFEWSLEDHGMWVKKWGMLWNRRDGRLSGTLTVLVYEM